MLIRKMEIVDLDVIVSLESQLFTSAWSYSDFLYELVENQFGHYFVIEDEQCIKGYVGLWIMYEQAQITTIGVDKKYQHQGIGKMMMEAMLNFIQEKGCEILSLEVRVSNQNAISLYEKYGFKKEAVRKDYYKDNHEDAYLMVKRLEMK